MLAVARRSHEKPSVRRPGDGVGLSRTHPRNSFLRDGEDTHRTSNASAAVGNIF